MLQRLLLPTLGSTLRRRWPTVAGVLRVAIGQSLAPTVCQYQLRFRCSLGRTLEDVGSLAEADDGLSVFVIWQIGFCQ